MHDLNIYSFDCGTVDANRRGCINTSFSVLANSSAGEWNCDVLDDDQIKRALKGVLELQLAVPCSSAGTCSRRT